MSDSATIQKAAEAIYDKAVAVLADERGVHAETAAALLAITAGMTLFRKHHGPAPKAEDVGTPVLSDAVDETAPDVIATLSAVAERFQVDLTFDPDADVPEEHRPVAEPVELLRKHGSALWSVVDGTSLDADERILASVIAVVLLLREIATMVPVEASSAIVLWGFTVGAKTYPPV
jgi:hypothetical protein